jgi:hypothetical protein
VLNAKNMIGKREDIKIDARSYKRKIKNEKNTIWQSLYFIN